MGVRKPECWPIYCVVKIMFSHFDTDHECDMHTHSDMQNFHISQHGTCIPSCSNTCFVVINYSITDGDGLDFNTMIRLYVTVQLRL